MKDAGRSNRVDKAEPDDTPPVSVPQTDPRPQDGRRDRAHQDRNREDMGVAETTRPGTWRRRAAARIPDPRLTRGRRHACAV